MIYQNCSYSQDRLFQYYELLPPTSSLAEGSYSNLAPNLQETHRSRTLLFEHAYSAFSAPPPTTDSINPHGYEDPLPTSYTTANGKRHTL